MTAPPVGPDLGIDPHEVAGERPAAPGAGAGHMTFPADEVRDRGLSDGGAAPLTYFGASPAF